MSEIVYNNRELSWLDFNYRVLMQSQEGSVPLLERLKFIAIHSSNLDEFFMVRVAGLKAQVDANYEEKDISLRSPKQQLNDIAQKVANQVNLRYRLFDKLKSLCTKKGIIINPKEIISQIYDIFYMEIAPVLSSVALNNVNRVPFIQNLCNSFFVEIEKENKTFYSILIIPHILPKVFKIRHKGKSIYYTTPYIIEKFLDTFFTGYKIKRHFLFRITRNADLPIQQEAVQDLLEAIEQFLDARKKSNIVRVEVDRSIDENLILKIMDYFEVDRDSIYQTQGILDYTYLYDIKETKKSLYYGKFTPIEPIYLKKYGKMSFFEILKREDILFFRPFHTFNTVINFLKEAVFDKNVSSIKITLYRTNNDSKIIELLEQAAKSGKHVSAVIELKARFDEEKNVGWAKRLENAGCIVTYGFLDLKIHTKCMLVLRKENGSIVRYTHISTGNYNENTSMVYTDIDYITKDEATSAEIVNLFNYMMGYSEVSSFEKIVVAPKQLRQYLTQLIDYEIKQAKSSKRAQIIAKLNSIYDKQITDKLYEASMAGVKINLIVRGLCSVVAQKKSISENIHIKSVIGRFLEHARILFFYAGSKNRVFISTADWMVRNFDKRIEIMYEVKNQKAIAFLKEILQINLKDNAGSWELKESHYIKNQPKSENEKFVAQEYLLKNMSQII